MFELKRFIADCRAALNESLPQLAIKELVDRAVSRPADVEAALGTPRWAEIGTLYRSPELTILNIVWAPGMTLLPHDHRMWAVIGIYTGREDNIFWRRVPGSPGGKVEAVSARALSEKDSVPLGHQVIHSVTNPIPRLTGAIHVYGGDFFGVPRSEWDPETLLEQPSDGERIMRRLEEANALYVQR